MRITERIWSPDGHSLKDDITVEDPKAFTRPWTTEKTYYRRPDWETVEYDPQENTRDFDKPGAGAADQGFHPPGGDVQAAADAPPPPPPPTPPAPPRKPGPLATTEDLQKATALAVGNLAWETVTVRSVQRDPDKVTWVGATRSVNWRCGAHPDGTQPYCEQ
jgi:hypothetical protein